MAGIIDTEDTWVYFVIMVIILLFILKTDTEVLIRRQEAEAAEGITEWFREGLSSYWPAAIGILGIFIFMIMNTRQGRGGYISLFIAMFMAIFFTSYTLYQWEEGGEKRTVTGIEGRCAPVGEQSGRTTTGRTATCLPKESAAGNVDACQSVVTAVGGCYSDASGGEACATDAQGDGPAPSDTTNYEFKDAAANVTPQRWARESCEGVRYTAEGATADGGTAGAQACTYTPPVIGGEDCASSEVQTGRPCPAGCKTEEGSTATSTAEADAAADSDCSFILPNSNHFQTKDYKIYRLIYFTTLIVVAACAANNIGSGYAANMVIFLPFIVPLFTEVSSELVNFIYEGEPPTEGASPGSPNEGHRTLITPEMLLINFLRGGITGVETPGAAAGDDQGSTAQTISPSAVNEITTGVANNLEPSWLEEREVDGQVQEAYFNSHFMFTMIFYLVLMFLMITHSQGFMGNSQSNVPIYITLILMIGFPFFMTYIFVQRCSIDQNRDNLVDVAVDKDGVIVSSFNAEDRINRLIKKNTWVCKLEKYGGLQMMLCASLIIMVLVKTQQTSDKAMAFIVMILLTYGLSQTFIAGKVYQ